MSGRDRKRPPTDHPRPPWSQIHKEMTHVFRETEDVAIALAAVREGKWTLGIDETLTRGCVALRQLGLSKTNYRLCAHWAVRLSVAPPSPHRPTPTASSPDRAPAPPPGRTTASR